MIGPVFSKNGELLPVSEATIPLDSIEFTYGFGVYENLKIRNRILYFAEKHCQRLLHSAKYIGITTKQSPKEIHEQITNLIGHIEEDSFNLKMLLLGNKEDADLYIMALAPKFLPAKNYTQGVQVITYKGERQFPQAKTLNMLMSYLAFKEAKNNNCYDALLVHEDGEITEGTRTNLFFTDGDTIFTAPTGKVLNGVTRITLIEALKEENIEVKEKVLKKDKINEYSGFFLTSTSSKVVPISQIDNKKIEIPDIVKKVIKVYNKYLKEYEKRQKGV